MKKNLIVLFFVVFTATTSFSQNYSTAIGIKSGYPGHGSLNIKHFLSSNGAIDVLAGSNFSAYSKYIWAQCLFEVNKNIVNMSRFNWYAGAGPSLGYYNAGSYVGKIALEGGPYLNVIPQIYIDGQVNVALRYAIQ